jgi:hypothetical protein
MHLPKASVAQFSFTYASLVLLAFGGQVASAWSNGRTFSSIESFQHVLACLPQRTFDHIAKPPKNPSKASAKMNHTANVDIHGPVSSVCRKRVSSACRKPCQGHVTGSQRLSNARKTATKRRAWRFLVIIKPSRPEGMHSAAAPPQWHEHDQWSWPKVIGPELQQKICWDASE